MTILIKLEYWKTREQNFFALNGNQIRVKNAAAYIEQSDTAIVDFGAGDMGLKQYLSESVKYIPLDYCKRCEDTFVLDINKDKIPDFNATTAFIAGFLEWVEEPLEFIKDLCRQFQKIILTCQPAEFRYFDSMCWGFIEYPKLIETIYDNGFYICKNSCFFATSNYFTMDEMIIAAKKMHDGYESDDYFDGNVIDFLRGKSGTTLRVVTDFSTALSEYIRQLSFVELKDLFLALRLRRFDIIREIREIRNGNKLIKYRLRAQDLIWLKEKPLCIWGVGLRGRQLLNILGEHKIVANAVVDKRYSDIKEIVVDKIIYDIESPSIIRHFCKFNYNVVITMGNVAEPLAELTALGIVGRGSVRTFSDLINVM